RDKREKLELYLEGSIGLPKKAEDVADFEKEVIASKEAGVSILRTVCLGTRRYESLHSQSDFDEYAKNSLAWVRLAEPIVRKHKMKLAIENHKDWMAPELVDFVKTIDSEWVGVTVDFGNSIALMEEPMNVVETLAPYAFTTHVKDMGVMEYEKGFLLSEVPLGMGICDLKKMVDVCKKHNPDIRFNLEMITRDPLEIPCLTDDYWNVFEGVSGKYLANTLSMVKEKASKTPLPSVAGLTAEQRLAFEEENNLACLKYSVGNLNIR
ncbi:MAG: TIM barrel protein, partial [Imperialibacter sp.]|uniref:sugar phosphate isomerase/epimerase family protein n=1 Tax=Imperialibacter sp. TaxID=2038411 RepID=UPI0032ED4422